MDRHSSVAEARIPEISPCNLILIDTPPLMHAARSGSSAPRREGHADVARAQKCEN
jgi:hypothetical protein